MLRPKRAALAALLAVLAACSGGDAPLGPSAGDGPRATISDAPRGGNPGFYFLPPMVASPSYSGTFDPTQPAEVEICELVGGVCGPVLATFTTTSGHGSERVRVQADHYVVNFHGNRFNLDPAKFYRITVRVGSFVLGYADVDVVRNGKEEKNVDPAVYVAMKQNQTLPIKFRIEVGAVNPNTPPVAGDDAIDAIGNVTVPVSAPGLLANDTDADPGDVLTVVPGTVATAQGGTATLNADGSFTYLSPAGFTGGDSFPYTVTDGDDSAVGTVTVTVAGRVWYVKNDAPAPGDGRDASPFSALASAEAASAAGETIFVLFGDGTIAGLDAGITLKANQPLIGQGIPSDITTTLNGETVTLLAAGTSPTIGRSGPGTTVQLATDNTVRGLGIASFDGAAVAGAAFGTLTMSEVAIAAAGGPGVDLQNGTAAVSLSNLSSTGSADAGANLVNVSGSFTAAAGSISGAAGTGFRVDGGDALVGFGGDVSSSAGRPVAVTDRAGGSVTLSGSISGTGLGILAQDNGAGSVVFSGPSVSLSTGGNVAVTLANNAGSSVSFSGGGLQAATSGAVAFSATGGGTVTAGGANNTLAATGAAALRVVGTDIGAAGLVFRSVSSSGGANGIVLDGTGAAGGLTVSGSGVPGSGGEIAGHIGADGSGAGIGISLNATSDVSLAFMDIHDHGNFAIRGVDVDGFTLAASTVGGVNGNAALEGGVSFSNLTGAAVISGSTLSGGHVTNLRVVNASGVLDRISLSSSTFGGVSTTDGGDAVYFEASGSAVLNVTAQNSTFNSARLDLFQVELRDDATSDVVLQGNSFHNTHPAIVGGGGGVVLGGGNAGSTATLTFDVDGNSFRGALGSALAVAEGLGTNAFSGTIANNLIGQAGVPNSGSAQGSGISITSVGGGSNVVAVTGNQVRQYNNQGILLQLGDNALGGQASLDATITGNTVANPGTAPTAKNGVHLNAGITSGDANAVCVFVSGNTLTGAGSGGAAGTDVRLRQRFLTSVRLPGYAGAPNDNAAVAAYVQANNAGGPTVLAQNNVAGGAPGFVGGAACAQP